MDADGRIIPIVEDDQGEGFKDPIDDLSQLLTEQETKLRSVVWEPLEEPKQEPKSETDAFQIILAKIERLERLIDHIFDGHILINGRFTKL